MITFNYILKRIKVNPINGCWEWQGAKNADGYGQAWNGQRNMGAHRLSWMLANDDDPHSLQVLHTCDQPACVNPQHLYLGTHKDNIRDCVQRKRRAKPKHSDDFIRFILNSPLKDRELSRIIGLHRAKINDIRHYRHRFKRFKPKETP